MYGRAVIFVVAALTAGETALPACAQAIDTPRRCEAAVRIATRESQPNRIPSKCWRIGPVALGMSRPEVERALGQPDFTSTHGNSFYIYPRNLLRWMRKHPVRMEDFILVSLVLMYKDDHVDAITVPDDTAISYPACHAARISSTPRNTYKPRFPFRFSSISIGDRLESAFRKLGHYAGSNRPHDWFEYWPVPLALTSYENNHPRTVDAITIATDERAMSRIPELVVSANLDPTTCFVNGYTFNGE
jgi:hypothetical protein